MGIDQISRAIRLAKDVVRWDHWYESKLPLFFIVGYTLIILEGGGLQSFWNYIRLVCFSASYLAFGYAVNDYCDQDMDLQVGKPNRIAYLQKFSARIIITTLMALSIVFLPIKNLHSVSLALIAFFFMGFYSMPPLRFKERGFIGLLVAAAAQRTLPTLLFFETFNHWGVDVLILSVLYTFIGLRWILGHQLWDIENDRSTGIHTFTTKYGERVSRRILVYLVAPLEVLFLILTVINYRGILPWLVYILGFYSIWFGITLWRRNKHGIPFTVFSPEWIPLADFYFILWPLSLVASLAINHPLYWFVFIGNLFWQHWLIFRQVDLFRHLLSAPVR